MTAASDYAPVGPPGPRGVGLALSGGGFRATLFHLGSLQRLNELGFLPKLDRVVSVSGGSIAAAVLALAWERLQFDENGVAKNLLAEVVAPLRAFCSHNFDVWTIARGLLTPWRLRRPGNLLADGYARELFGDACLRHFPPAPRFVILSVELHSGVTFSFSPNRVGCYVTGWLEDGSDIRVADCVAASSAFPPVFSPFAWRLPADLVDSRGERLRLGAGKRVFLADGGTIDNLGMEGIFEDVHRLLVSDAGKTTKPMARSWFSETWLMLTIRAVLIAAGVADPMRKRRLISAFADGSREGTYWSTRLGPESYGLTDALRCDDTVVSRLSQLRTRLNRFSLEEQELLINLGYALADTAIRRHVLPGPPPRALPHPSRPLEAPS